MFKLIEDDDPFDINEIRLIIDHKNNYCISLKDLDDEY